MKSFLRRHYEKFVAGLAALGMVGSIVWSMRAERYVDELHAPVAVSVTAHPSIPNPAWPKPDSGEVPAWSRPPAQSGGAGWVYELFTPPTITYRPATRSLAAASPSGNGDESEKAFGLHLREIKREPFRLQLGAYCGEEGHYLVALVDSQSRQIHFARVGDRLPELGVTLRSFAVRKLPAGNAEDGPMVEVAGVAVLQDERTGGEVVLDTRGPRATDTALAVVEYEGKSLALREGESFVENNVAYRIERIDRSLGRVVVAKTAPGAAHPETSALRLEHDKDAAVAWKPPEIAEPGDTSAAGGQP